MKTLAVLLVVLSGVAVAVGGGLRAPSALQLLDDEKTLVVALERGGGLALIDVETFELRGFADVEGSFTDLVALGGGRLLATDFEGARVVLFRVSEGAAEVLDEESAPPYPVTAVAQPNSERVFVASLWSKRLSVVELIDSTGLYLAKSVELPFEPRRQLLAPDGSVLVVADAFGGGLAVVDPVSLDILQTQEIPGHNIGGLLAAPGGSGVLVSHQRLNRLARTSFDDIHWGMTLNNGVRHASLETPKPGKAPDSPFWMVGDVGAAAGDPGPMTVLKDGRIALAIGGTGEVVVGNFGSPDLLRFETGSRPTAILADAAGERLFVANQLDDLISVIDLEAGQLLATISLSPGLELSSVERGERLFFNARMSHDGWFSCHSCHTNGHTNGLAADTRGDGSFGAPKQIPSLLGVVGTAPFGWIGNMPQLADQVRATLESTMIHDAEDLGERDVDDLVAFLESLPPPAPVSPAETAVIARGRAIFEARSCQRCHSGPARTINDVFDVGLTDEMGIREFNPPSLRGVGLRRRLFHDGRAESLEAVFAQHKHQLETPLTDDALEDLVSFLRSL